jgi:hypothetical protein
MDAKGRRQRRGLWPADHDPVHGGLLDILLWQRSTCVLRPCVVMPHAPHQIRPHTAVMSNFGIQCRVPISPEVKVTAVTAVRARTLDLVQHRSEFRFGQFLAWL